MGIDLLVLAGWSIIVCEDLLRVDRVGRCPRFTPPGGKGACGNIFLSKRNGAVAESVCLSFCTLVVDLG